jgi:large-conductance mechanosensitive channel
MAQNSLLLTFAVAIFVGGALKDFFQSFITNLVMPFLVVLFPSAQKSVGDFVVDIGPVKLKVGDAIAATMTLVVSLVVVSIAMPWIREYSPVQGGRRQ